MSSQNIFQKSGTITKNQLKPLKKIITPSQLQPCGDCTVWIVDMGNEMGNQNVSGMQEQDGTMLEASKESVEVSVASINATGEDANRQVSSPKGDSHEYNIGFASQDSSGAEQDKTEIQDPEGSSKAPMGTDNHNGIDGGMQSVSSIEDGEFHQPTSAPPEENLARSRDNQIRRQASNGKEGEETLTLSPDTKSTVCHPISMELEIIKSDQHESAIAHTELSVSSSEYQKTIEHTSLPSEENLCRTNENQTESQQSVGGEREETRNPSVDSKSRVPNPQSVELKTVTNQHKSSISEPSIPLSENGDSNKNGGSPSDDNSSTTNDNQVQRQASIGGEGEDARNSSIDSKSRVHNPKAQELETLKSDKQKSTVAHTELSVGARSKLLGSNEDIPRSSKPQDYEGKRHKLEDEVAHSLEEIYIPHFHTKVEKIGEDMRMQNMASQDKEVVDISITNGVNSEIINGIEVENTNNGIEAKNRCTITPTPEVENIGNEEKELTSSNSFGYGRDSRVSQSEAVFLTESIDSFQIEASEPECKYIVLTNNRKMIENGSESEQKGYDSNITLLSEGLLEESNANEMNNCQSEYVIVGSDHGEERKQSELCDSYKSMIQSGRQIDDENRILDVFKFDMLDSNQSLISEESCEELEGETKMVVVGIVPTESILTDSNHGEGKLLTSSSSSLDPTPNKVIIEAMEKIEDADLIRKVQEGRETIDSSLSQLHPIEVEETFLPQEKWFCTKGQVSAVANCIPDSKETDSIPEVEIHSEVSKLPNLDFEFLPESNHTPLLSPEKTAKGEEFEVFDIQLGKQLRATDKVSVVLSCGSETLLNTERLTTDSTPENINFHVDVIRSLSFDFELPLEERIEESDQTPLLSQERTANGDVFQLKCCGSKTLANRVDVNIENPDAGTESSALGPGKEKSERDQLPHEKMSTEKQVIALRRTSSEKLTPLLDFLKDEEKYANESEKKNKGTVAKKSVQDGWSLSTEKDTATSHRVRAKRKPKYSLFSNCMGCTDAMP
ncbi:hypothetical protein NE237_012232 [Protea cynaroides]|uniref:Uncharacterized protein n=1 Tax=Protea cynaroides TaxID=273540 RepID=A0A9Q0H1G2_9MAGN|nr:hypothetical protein NE237_012232 [Protea cynaroides]